MTDARDDFIDLVSRQLAAFARLGALSHLDLKLIGVDQIFARDAEARRRNLFDSARSGIAVRIRNVPRRILAAFSRIASPANTVHRDGQRLVPFLADRSATPGPAFKSFPDRFSPL